MPKLPYLQEHTLAAICAADGWLRHRRFGSSTLKALERRGYVQTRALPQNRDSYGRIQLEALATDAGRAALQEGADA